MGGDPDLTAPYVFGASVVGPLHVQMGLPCQDASDYWFHESGLGVIAVADGLGSAAKSDVGARTAVAAGLRTAVAAAGSDLTDDTALVGLARAALIAARQALQDRARLEPCDLRDLACTLIVAAIVGDRVAVAHVGDGAVVGQGSDGLRLLSAPGFSEYANEVVPLTSDGWQEAVRTTECVSSIKCLALFTDGCQRAALARHDDRYVPYGGFFDPVFAYARELTDLREAEQELRALLASEKLCRNCEDDKTLVVAVLGGPGPSEP